MVIFGEAPAYTDAQLQIYNEILKINRYIEKSSYYTTVEGLIAQRDDLTAAIEFVESAEEAANYIQDAEVAIDALVSAKTHYTLSGNTWNENDQTGFYNVWDHFNDLDYVKNKYPEL